MHFRQLEFTYSTCGPFTRHCERFQKLKETSDLSCICKSEVDKTCFEHDAMYADSKDLDERTVSDKVLKDTAKKIILDPKYDGYQGELASMVCKVFDKKTRLGTNVNEVIAQEEKCIQVYLGSGFSLNGVIILF